MTKEEVMALVQEKAPELADRVLAAEEPVGALLEAWAEARKIRETADTEAQGKRVDLEGRLAASEANGAEYRRELDGLRGLAEDGRAYRTELVEQAVKARVRAQGDAFDAEAYRKMLGTQELGYVRSEIQAWEASARQVFEPGRPAGKVLLREQDKVQTEAGRKKAPGSPSKVYKA